MARCRICENEMTMGEPSCRHCGAVHAEPPLKDQTRAVLLAAFLGDFGLHRFYLGQPLAGLLYLVFFWTGVPGVLASLESYRFAFMSREAWAERYNGSRLGKPVPRWLPAALILVPLIVLAVMVAAIYAGYD
jgi:TM2 domain-containing membrane protein YozV